VIPVSCGLEGAGKATLLFTKYKAHQTVSPRYHETNREDEDAA